MRYAQPLINQEQAKHLALRDRVPSLVLNVLSRAEGLDLLQYPEDRSTITPSLKADDAVPYGSQFVGFEFTDGELLYKYEVITDVPYPDAGYPEAYGRYFGDIPYQCDLPVWNFT